MIVDHRWLGNNLVFVSLILGYSFSFDCVHYLTLPDHDSLLGFAGISLHDVGFKGSMKYAHQFKYDYQAVFSIFIC